MSDQPETTGTLADLRNLVQGTPMAAGTGEQAAPVRVARRWR